MRKKPFEYLLSLTKEIEETTIFRYAEEPWAVEEKIQEGALVYIKILDDELNRYLFGDLKSKREFLTEEQIAEILNARAEAIKKAEARFGHL